MAPSSWPGFTSGQVTFAERLAADTGLNVGVIAAWEQAEENGSAAAGRQASGNHNWLNIGYFDSGPGQIAFNSAFSDPTSGADQTARFLKGTWGGASSGIRGIMGTVGKSPQAQISTIQTSGWASGGYPSLPGIYNGLSASIKNAAPGGVAGAGGTGTLTNLLSGGKPQANFSVGDSTNPDEDYWTAINRLAQERYWYLFSDGETLYLADGPDLMKQEPAARLDRIGNLDQINRLSYSWDNTAWRYAATHKKRKRAQRRTSLAKIVSPTEATLDLICAIDEARAGDVIDFSNTGPGDGSWLVGDCRRSVFEILSEINMVPALTPLAEKDLTPAGINTNNLSSLLGGLGTGTGNYKGYVNPVGKWAPSRIDAGVDGTLVSDYLAPGDSHIMQADASNAGWAGGGAIGGRFLNGPLAGKVWYVTEGVAPLVPPSSNVTAGTPVARRATSPYNGIVGNIETGWGQPGAATAPMGSGGDQSPNALAFGDSFNRFLRRVGAAPGHRSGAGVGVTAGPLPPGYP